MNLHDPTSWSDDEITMLALNHKTIERRVRASWAREDEYLRSAGIDPFNQTEPHEQLLFPWAYRKGA